MAFKLHHIDGCIAVQGCRVVLHGAQMACARVVLCLTVIHGGKVVVFVLHCMGRNAVGHLCSGIKVQRGVIRHHPAKQGNVCRGGCAQCFLVLFFVCTLFHGQLCQRLDLCLADEEQGLGAFLIVLDACIVQRLLGQLGSIFFRGKGGDLLFHQLCHLFGALAHILFVQQAFLYKGLPHGVLPRLRGDPGAGHAAVNGRFGAARIVPVDAAGRHSLQHMKVNIQTLFHKSVLLFLRFGRFVLLVAVEVLPPPQTDVGGQLCQLRGITLQPVQVNSQLRVIQRDAARSS